mmetsp:Transcript_12076/g.15563  ORF Transcript_12076/g.15563 Transcript_12076/m.15563 type:complete len:430 (+) Transcript_12076:57-1346(+)
MVSCKYTVYLQYLLLLNVVDACRIIAFAGHEPISGRRLLLETENSLPELAYDRPFLPALEHSSNWNAQQCGMRNAHENRDGWGVGWYPTDSEFSFPLRFRTMESIVSDVNSTSPTFYDILDGNHEISLINEAKETSGLFEHSQGFLENSVSVGSCGTETKQTPKLPLESRVVFGHVRKATSNINDENAHPFVFNHLLFMHNGMLADFELYQDILLRRLRPAVRGMLQGGVDSEHAGALFCNNLEGFPKRRDYSMAEMRGAMRTMIAELRALSAEASLHQCHKIHHSIISEINETSIPSGKMKSWSPSSMNFAVSDGQGIIVTRFRSKDDEDPPSLYYKLGVESYVSNKDKEDTSSVNNNNNHKRSFSVDGLVVASEPLEESGPDLSKWRLLGKDKMISYHPNEGVKIECLSHQCTSDTPADVDLFTTDC